MDFAFLPPEINSVRMYSGPGSGRLLAAAGSWDSLSAELGTTAQVWESVLWGLTSLQWRGPTAQAMAASTGPFIGWLRKTAEQAMHTAMQARTAAAAFELAHAMIVPPAAVAANRTQLAALIATNFFGQNTAAIAATEAQYAEYWAQDAAAMSAYAASSAEATQFTQFSSPQSMTTPDGVTPQQAAVVQALDSAASNPLLETASGVANPLSNISLKGIFLIGIQTTNTAIGGVSGLGLFAPAIIGAVSDLAILPTLGAAPVAAAAATTLIGAPRSSGPASSLSGGAPLGDVRATLVHAHTIGTVSVPATWSASTGSPAITVSETGLSGLGETGESVRPGTGIPGVPGMPAGTGSRASGVVPRYGARLTVMARPPAAG